MKDEEEESNAPANARDGLNVEVERSRGRNHDGKECRSRLSPLGLVVLVVPVSIVSRQGGAAKSCWLAMCLSKYSLRRGKQGRDRSIVHEMASSRCLTASKRPNGPQKTGVEPK